MIRITVDDDTDIDATILPGSQGMGGPYSATQFNPHGSHEHPGASFIASAEEMFEFQKHTANTRCEQSNHGVNDDHGEEAIPLTTAV